MTACRNAADDLEKTIESLRSQQSRDFAYVVVDGASTDSTGAVIHRNADIITNSLSEPDSGIAEAFNKGVSLAQTPWLLFLNAGDLLCDASTMSVMISAIASHGDSDVIYGDVQVESPLETWRVTCDHTAFHARAPGNPLCHQAALIRRDRLLTIPYTCSLRYSMDYEWWLHAQERGVRFVKINHILCRYKLGGVSSSPKRAVAALREHWMIYRRHFPGVPIGWWTVTRTVLVLQLKISIRLLMGKSLYTKLKTWCSRRSRSAFQ